ncbi:MAG: acyloxyacyl hydrolase [Pseudomonadota bacterium]
MTLRILLTLLLLLPSLLRADLIGIDVGRGNHNSRDSTAVFFRYVRDLRLWEGMPFYGEFLAGRWDGAYENQSFSLGLGLRYPLPGDWSLGASGGIGYVHERNNHLGTHPQFVFRFGINYRFGKNELSLTQRHYSNGKGLFRWDEPNVGENFIMLGLAREF